MNSADLEVLNACVTWLAQGNRALLVTVVKTWGSSPRPEGAMMAVRDDGAVVGSVSGGCIEDDLIEQVKRKGIEMSQPYVLKYGISAEEAHRFGLPCGGTIELVLEPLKPESRIEELRVAVASGRLIARRLDLSTGNAELANTSVTEGVTLIDGKMLAVHGPRYRMLVIGAGQLSQYLCEVALGLDYQVTVCDPRIEYADFWTVKGTFLNRSMPDDCVIEMGLDKRTAVIALTHDPKLDDLALMEALRSPAFYVGALGSRRNNANRRERLRDFDLSQEQVDRLRGPVGIYIGSRTPPEIAVSILAEVIAAKNGVTIPEKMGIVHAKSHAAWS